MSFLAMQHELLLEQNDFAFNNDPISVAILRLEQGSVRMMHDIEMDPKTRDILNAGDYDQRAAKIRDYYKKKLMLGAFNSNFANTRFRQNLHSYLIKEDQYIVNGSEIGFIARLPEFMEEDLAKDMIADKCDTSKHTPGSSYDDERVTVKYICRTMKRHGSNKQYTYWFYKPTDKRAFCFEVEANNPFRYIWENIAEVDKVFTLTGHWKLRVQDDFYFYQSCAMVTV